MLRKSWSEQDVHSQAAPSSPARSTRSKTKAVPASPSASAGFDEQLGFSVYSSCKANKLKRLLADLASMSGDEIVWFIAPAILGSGLFARRLMIAFSACVSQQQIPATFPAMGCAEEFLWDVFGSSAACVLVESILKAIFQRDRPSYVVVKQNFTLENPTVPYEEFSFPSGEARERVRLTS